MALNLITSPAATPVLLADVEAQVRASLTAETTLINLYIAAVTKKAEDYTGRALITQTWEYSLDHFPICNSAFANPWRVAAINLPLAPVQSITSVKYYDVDGVLQTISSADYTLTSDDPNQILPAYGKSWPSTRIQPGAVIIRYVAGYGLAVAVPEPVRAWILMNVASLYENRETVSIGKGQMADLNTLADSLLDPYVLRTFA